MLITAQPKEHHRSPWPSATRIGAILGLRIKTGASTLYERACMRCMCATSPTKTLKAFTSPCKRRCNPYKASESIESTDADMSHDVYHSKPTISTPISFPRRTYLHSPSHKNNPKKGILTTTYSGSNNHTNHDNHPTYFLSCSHRRAKHTQKKPRSYFGRPEALPIGALPP